MKEIILIKLGEITLKGLNRRTFEDILKKNIKNNLRDLGAFKISSAQSTLYVEPIYDDVDLDEVSSKIKAYNLEDRVKTLGWISKNQIEEQLKKSKTPTLFIHGSEDKFVPFYMLDEVYNVATCKKDKLVIEGAAHAESDRVNPDLYWSKIDEFIKENIND